MEKNKIILVILELFLSYEKISSHLGRLALSDVLHVPSIRVNLIYVALLGKVGVKVSFKYDKIVMTKNNVFVGKGYCDQGLFVLNVSKIINESISMSSAYIVDSLFGMLD